MRGAARQVAGVSSGYCCHGNTFPTVGRVSLLRGYLGSECRLDGGAYSLSLLGSMPSGDDLTIIIFLASTALALSSLILSRRGWRHWAITGLIGLATFVCVVGAIAWPWLKDWSPVAPAYVQHIARSPVAWFAVVLASLASVALLGRQQSKLEHDNRNLRTALTESRHNTLHNALRIVLEHDERYERVQTFQETGLTRRIMHIAVRNVGDGTLSECLLWLRHAVPVQKAGAVPTILAAEFRLQRGEHKFIPVVGYVEHLGTQQPSEHVNSVVVSVVHDGSFFAGWTLLEVPQRNAPAIITLEATALETNTYTAQFKLWVDPDRRFHMEAM